MNFSKKRIHKAVVNLITAIAGIIFMTGLMVDDVYSLPALLIYTILMLLSTGWLYLWVSVQTERKGGLFYE